MTKDRNKIREIIEEMLAAPDNYGEYDKSTAYDKLEALVRNTRGQAIGWTHTYVIVEVDAGSDPKEIDVPEMLARAELDLNPPTD